MIRVLFEWEIVICEVYIVLVQFKIFITLAGIMIFIKDVLRILWIPGTLLYV